MKSKELYVSIQLGDDTIPVGKLWCHQRGMRQSASFEYEQNWLKHPERFALDPALQLTKGAFHTQADQMLFGAIGDSAPDRWGRVLMRRAESARAKAVNEAPRTLLEADYLLGVNDEARQGALRFSHNPDGPFLTPKGKTSIPPLIDLPRLLSAAERYLDDNETALVSNTDDHLRNHGFMYKRHKGWRLSPAYDINPTPVEIKAHILSTAIDFDDPSASIDTALSVIDEFRIKKNRANEIIQEVSAAVNQWQKIAVRYGLEKREFDRMASAFEHENCCR